MTPRYGHAGQTIVETIVLFPIFLLFVLGLIQLGQLGVGIVVANYAASSIARQIVREGKTGNQPAYVARLQNLQSAGMYNPKVGIEEPVGGLMSDVTVCACAQIDALPFVNYFVKHSIKLWKHYESPPEVPCEWNIENAMGPLYYHRQHYYWVVRGKATARMNYKP